MVIAPLKGKFYIYIYEDGIYINFNDYSTRYNDGSYTKSIRFPKNMVDKVINLITDLETKYSESRVVVHVYRNMSVDCRLLDGSTL